MFFDSEEDCIEFLKSEGINLSNLLGYMAEDSQKEYYESDSEDEEG